MTGNEAKVASRDDAIEAAAAHIYKAKGDRVGVSYLGWDLEPDSVRDEWRRDVRATIDAYEAALSTRPQGEAQHN